MFDFARGCDRVSMDGGAWLPLRIRYLPRWHHTGSYQLYTGEDLAGLGTKLETDRRAMSDSRGFDVECLCSFYLVTEVLF